MGWDGADLRRAKCAFALSLLCGSAVLLAPVRGRADENRALGQYLAVECTACHQLTGRSTGGIPPIVGWPEEEFVAALDAYGRRQRGGQVMQTIAARLSRTDMAALAAYFGALSPKP